MTDSFGRPIDLDQSGQGFHKARSYLGPSLGWVETQILPERRINFGGQTVQVNPGDQVILTEIGVPITFLLPDAKEWIAQNATQPATGFTRGLLFKDYGGNARDVHVTLVPFEDQTIDGLNQSLIISQDYEVIILHPLIDGTGWYAVIHTFDTGTGGTTAINATPPISGNVTGDIMNVQLLYDTSIFDVVGSHLVMHSTNPGFVLGNPTIGPASPIYTSISSILDIGIGSTQGQIMFRNNAQWTFLNPGTAGQVLMSGGAGGNPAWTNMGAGDVQRSGVPVAGQWAQWTDGFHIKGVDTAATPWVQKIGDTMTGTLTIDDNNPQLVLSSDAGHTKQLFGINKTANQARWSIQLGDGAPETGGNAGNNFSLTRYSDAGAIIDTPIGVNRASGSLTLTSPLSVFPTAGNPVINLISPAAPATVTVNGRVAGLMRWAIHLADGSPESGSDAGSNFELVRFHDDGSFIDAPLKFNRATGLGVLLGPPTAPLGIATKSYVDGLVGGATVQVSGVPVNGQVAMWTNANTIQGINPPWVQSSGPITSQYLAYFADATGKLVSAAFVGLGLTLAGSVLAVNPNEVQLQNADLTGLSSLVGTDTDKMFYRFSVGDWRPVTIGSNLTFSAGILSATGGGGGGGNVSNSGAPTNGQFATWTNATTIQGVNPASVLGLIGGAPVASPALTGTPTAPTPATADSSTRIATTAYVQAQGYLTAAAGATVFQPLDGDLTSLAAASGTNTIYYRSAFSTWSPVAIGANLTFTGGTLAATGGGGGGIPEPASDGDWVREVVSGVGSWVLGVKKAGDTFTGAVGIAVAGNPLLNLISTGANAVCAINGRVNSLQRWQLQLADGNAESGSNQGSNFALRRYDDSGTFIDVPLFIARNTTTTVIGPNPGSSIPSGLTGNLILPGLSGNSLVAAQYSTGTGGPSIFFSKSRGATIGTNSAVADGDTLGAIQWGGVAPSGAIGSGCALVGSVQGAPSGGIIPSGFGLNVVPVAGGSRRSMTFNSNQSVVIGPMPFALNVGVFEINNESAMALNGVYWSKWSNDAVGFELNLRKSRGLSSNLFTIVQLNDVLGAINFNGAYASGFPGNAPNITAYCAGIPNATGMPGEIDINTPDSTGVQRSAAYFTATGCGIRGSTLGDNAPGGYVGEFFAPNTFTNLTVAANTSQIVASLNGMSAGDWDVWVHGSAGATGTASNFNIGLNDVALTLPSPGTVFQSAQSSISTSFSCYARFTKNTTFTAYLNTTTGTPGAVQFNGTIYARRRR